MYEEFLDFLQKNVQKIFIEAEAREDKMVNFISDYNYKYRPPASFNTNGICLLGDVDKWGVELRIYFNNANNIPNYWNDRKYNNKKYRADEFCYRLDDNKLVRFLFDSGYRIGYN